MMTTMFRRLCCILSIGAALATPVMAATVTYSDTLPRVATSNPLATGFTGTLVQNVTGSITNDRRSPWDAPNSTVTDPAAVYSAVRNGTTYLDLGVVRGGISFVWGTPGRLNVFELFLNGISQFRAIGTDAVGTGSNASSYLTTISDVRFDRIEFSAGNPAFEFANLSIAAVPLPAGGLLLLGALGGLVLLRRRAIS